MCRGFQLADGDRLRIKAFKTQLSGSISQLPDSLTLHYLPRINGAPIEVNGSDIRADSPAFVTLHRLWSEEGSGAAYASRDRVAVCEGVKFEIYVWDVKAVRGIFRKKEEDDGEGWRMDCRADDIVEGVKGAEVAVEGDGEAEVMREKVEMATRRPRRRCCIELEEIPEVREEGELVSNACGCSECGGDAGVDGGDCEMEVEDVGWAVDVGIWVVCLGVGYLVSRASSRRFGRKRFL